MASPLNKAAKLKGTRTDQPIKSMERHAARAIGASWLVNPATTRARYGTTAPNQPTVKIICARSANF